MRNFVLKAVSIFTLSIASTAVAQGPTPIPYKRPEAPTSIANATSAHFRNGPLFKRAQAAFAAANERGEPAFAAFLSKKAKLEFSNYDSKGRLIQPMDVNFLRAIMASCDGPLSYDEGTDWVTLNWICRTDAEAPLTRLYTFRNSPEIVMLVYFDGDRIKSADAMEALMIPGFKRLVMDAYALMHGKQ